MTKRFFSKKRSKILELPASRKFADQLKFIIPPKFVLIPGFTMLIMSVFFTTILSAAPLDSPKLDDRWFYASFGVGDDAQAQELIALIQQASDAGLNGMLWECGLANYSRWDEKRKARLDRIKNAAESAHVEIIPILWSVGYGTMLGENPNLAEGLLIADLPMTVHASQAEAVSETITDFDGSMEQWKKQQLTDYAFHDQPGENSFRDSQTVHSGNSSIRFEKFLANEHGHGRLMKEMSLTPGRLYRATIWFRGEGVQGNLKLDIYDQAGNSLAMARPKSSDPSFPWTKATASFQSPAEGSVRIYAGIWNGTEGTFWLDDLSVESLGLVNPLQRPGTPIVVTDSTGQTVYEEGKDWVLPPFSLQPWNADAEPQRLTIPPTSRIQDGETVLVDYYYPPLVGAPQIGTCMSEPELYELFAESAQGVMQALAPKKWFLSMDEIRCAGTCQACHDRKMSLAAILGDCITRQYETIQRVAPGATVYIWSDMLDPNHNAVDNYYVCDGDYTGSWDLIPKELIISCWYHEKRAQSMKFFSEHGFRTQAAAYYDTDDLNNCVDWLETCQGTPGCTGIMYTTWQHKYELLPDFGKMLQNRLDDFPNTSLPTQTP